MDIRRVNSMTASQARGVVIVIDVVRAFTVAAYAFAGGARAFWLVRFVEEAYTLRKQEPEALLAGEVEGRLIPGFDLNNSPYLMSKADVNRKAIIQRTGAGTQGAVNASHATHLLICSLVNAQATASYARRLAESENCPITFLPTATIGDETSNFRNEDELCADYLEALLTQPASAPEVLANAISQIQQLHQEGRGFRRFEQDSFDFPLEDLPAALAANRFPFVMVGEHQQLDSIHYVAVKRIDIS